MKRGGDDGSVRDSVWRRLVEGLGILALNLSLVWVLVPGPVNAVSLKQAYYPIGIDARTHLFIHGAGTIVGIALVWCIRTLRRLGPDLEALVAEANAIVPDKEGKLLFVFDPKVAAFYDSPQYTPPPTVRVQDCYDVLTADPSLVHNFCLERTYLEYLFRRHKASGKATKLLVTESVNAGVVAYVVLTCLAKYETYVIERSLFARVVARQSEQVREILWGNAYVLEHADGSYSGRYSPGGDPRRNATDIPAVLCSAVLETLRDLLRRAHQVRPDVDPTEELARALECHRAQATGTAT